jgi:hypothetical protein
MISTNSHSFHRILQTIGLDENSLTQKAVKVGWLIRKPRKITPLNLLNAIYQKSHQALASYNNVASEIDTTGGNGPARQAVAKRMNKECQQLLEFLIEKAFEHKRASGLSSNVQGVLKPLQPCLGSG